MKTANATQKVISFKISNTEYRKLLKVAESAGVKIGPLVRGLMRKAFDSETPESLKQLVQIGKVFSRP